LGGDGGDELCAGYNHYLQKLNVKTNLFSRNLSKFSRNLPIGLKGRNYLLNTGVTFNETRGKQFFDDDTLLKSIGIDFSSKLGVFNKFKIDPIENLNKLLKFDFTNYLPDDVLFKVDRASMSNSLETRAPFLDKNLVEFAFGEVPEDFKLRGGIKKFLVKEFADQVLPKNFEFERKQGFSFPLHEKLMGDWKLKTLDLYNSFDNHIFNRDMVSNMIRNEGVLFNNSNRIYAVLVLQNWVSKYQIKL
jgi:asparagine synthase (glutamine-hydrolysing)